MSTVKVRPTNGVSHGLRHKITSDAVNIPAVAEVVTLTTTGAPSSDGNVTVSLPSLAGVPVAVIGIDVAEIVTLEVTGAPTSDGNVTTILPSLAGVATALIGTAVSEIVTLEVTGAPSVSGNVTITLPSLAGVPIAILNTDTTADVATKIRAATFTGWTTGGSSTTVTFTKDVAGDVSGSPSFVDTDSTGATATITVTTEGVSADTTTGVATKIRASTFTGWTTGGSGTSVTFTKDIAGAVSGLPSFTDTDTTGTTATISITTTGLDSDTINGVATKIRAATFTGWTTGGSNAVVTFTKNVAGAVSGTPTFVDTDTTGTTATITVTTQGADEINSYIDFDFRLGNTYRYGLVAIVTIVNSSGVVTNPADLTITYPSNGIVRVDGTLVADTYVNLVAQYANPTVA